ncbi:hypothetical protein EDI29_10280 [Pectobacterium polonicum]|nr:hypothetical protein EDI29_10280 [Pectobacterium polonicum]
MGATFVNLAGEAPRPTLFMTAIIAFHFTASSQSLIYPVLPHFFKMIQAVTTPAFSDCLPRISAHIR